MNLVQAYRSEKTVKETIHKLMAIGFLPEQDIINAFVTIQSNTPQYLNNYMLYFESYWINEIGPRLICFSALEHRTNNDVESWHNRFNKLVGKSHPNLYELIDDFKKEQILGEKALNELSVGMKLSYPSQLVRQKNERINQLLMQYQSKMISTDELLLGIGWNIADSLATSITKPMILPKKRIRTDSTENIHRIESL